MYTLASIEEAMLEMMSDTRRAVFDAVPEDKSIRRKEIIETTGLPGSDVDQQLLKLKKERLIKLVSRGSYQRTGLQFDEVGGEVNFIDFTVDEPYLSSAGMN